MKSLTKQEKRDALGSFAIIDDREMFTADRSTLERWASCPWAAKAVEGGRVKTMPLVAEAGEAVHQAFSRTIQTWIDSDGALSQSDIRQDAEMELRGTRPDLQPEALKASAPALWTWAKLIYGTHPGNILRFDGGEDIERSGQLAYDFDDLGVRVTSELDLLVATDSQEVLDEVDYKTGWKFNSVESIAGSFQFQLHAFLVFENYPGVNCLRVRVLDTRANHLSYRVDFSRNRRHDYASRIRSAIQAWREHHDNPPTWPTIEKCRICPAAALCPVADEPLKESSEGLLTQLVALQARETAIEEILAARVDEGKADIVAGGVCYGRNAPKSERKAPAKLYERKGAAGS